MKTILIAGNRTQKETGMRNTYSRAVLAAGGLPVLASAETEAQAALYAAAFDALIDQAARQTTLDGAIGYYHKAEELLFEDLPVIPLWYTNVTAAAGKQVGSLSFNYMGLPDYYKLTVKG